MRYLSAITMLILALAITQPVAAQSFKPDYRAGWEAHYLSKNYPLALKHFRPLAKQGDTGAQFLLGLMYYNGYAVLQDRAMAYVWWNVAATKGYSSAKDWRDMASDHISPSDHPLAWKLSKLCRRKPAKCPEYNDD